MGDKTEHEQIEPARPTTPWYRRALVITTAGIAALSAVLINGPTLLQNARSMPKEFRETKSQFESWVKEDDEWTGHWSSFPEGVANMSDMKLSDTDLEITVTSTQGRIDGTIATKAICRSIPIVNFVLLRGQVSGNSADVVAWDIVEGYDREFATLTLTREGDVMTVVPTGGHTAWFAPMVRIGRSPSVEEDGPSPSGDYCAEQREAFMKALEALGDRPTHANKK